MSETPTATKKSFSLDWLIGGVLTKFGDIFDRLTGRRWKPSSSLATSELTEKLKKLLDQEVKDLGAKGKFVPHNLKLKMQWDKFSTDSEKALNILQNELLIAAIDHINDHRYQTYEPLNFEVKHDYFTEGVKLIASFDKTGKEELEAAVNVTVPEIKVGDYAPEPFIETELAKEVFTAEFSLNGKTKQVQLEFTTGRRRSVGRNRQNDLTIDDTSVSKIHAALVLNKENQFQIADTGSTNGTFINGQRISYGKAMTISDTDKIKFGTIEVLLTRQIQPEVSEPVGIVDTAPKTEVLLNSEQLIPQNDFSENRNIPENQTAQNAPEIEPEPESKADKKEVANENKDLTQQEIIFDFENQPDGKQK
ncbi:MAG: FHA domain-containing protein [Pyrinomonadaceae bacterium]